MLLNSHISAYVTCFARKVCGLVQSTWGTSLGEDKLGAKDRILNTKVARRACAGRATGKHSPCVSNPLSLRSMYFSQLHYRGLETLQHGGQGEESKPNQPGLSLCYIPLNLVFTGPRPFCFCDAHHIPFIQSVIGLRALASAGEGASISSAAIASLPVILAIKAHGLVVPFSLGGSFLHAGRNRGSLPRENPPTAAVVCKL